MNAPKTASVARPLCSARELLRDDVRFLQPEEAVFDAMRRGWANQQRSRLLAAATVRERLTGVVRFASFTNEYPWQWRPADLEEWTASLVARGLAHSTVRNYQNGLALFVEYVLDPVYEWAAVCERLFGRTPGRICQGWNMAVHREEDESRPGNRAMTREELQAFFDYADERIAHKQTARRKGTLAAYRDSALFKTIYGWGLRRREVTGLEVVDVQPNPNAPQLGRAGLIRVRHGKARRGGPPRNRTVLTVMDWAAEALEQYLVDVRPCYEVGPDGPLWPTERGGRVNIDYVHRRFAEYRLGAGLDPELGPHCMRHSYASHLAEDGRPQLFIQEQMGHSTASSTAIYTHVSNDFRNRVIHEVLEELFAL
jgi:integrase/recombinase XerC